MSRRLASESLIELVSQCANSVCVSLFIMLCHADLHPNRSLKWLVSVQIVCVYRYSLCYVTQTCVRINFMSSSLSIAEVASATLK